MNADKWSHNAITIPIKRALGAALLFDICTPEFTSVINALSERDKQYLLDLSRDVYGEAVYLHVVSRIMTGESDLIISLMRCIEVIAHQGELDAEGDAVE